ncbi:MAG: D-2-hydroxyacid dehydrogenase [Chloroflexi bacterium]|nr:D-2-hydroxyacid dehydrogenase [Chloroflexota bacterium]
MPNLKVMVTHTHLGDDFVDNLRSEFPDVDFQLAMTNEEQLQAAPEADIICGWPSSKEVLEAAHRLRWIHCPGTGIDAIMKNLPELADSDVVLTNARGPHAAPMADHVLWMMISLAHQGREMARDQNERYWSTAKYDHGFVELAGSTMGILALGDIGKAVARRAFGFEIDVYAVDLHPAPPPPQVKEVWGLDRLDELMGISDWFVVAAPLTAESRGLIDARRIGLMKPSARLFVISRGGIVDEDALAAAIREGKLAGAGIDATEIEPLPQESPLWGLDNVILSPHASALTPEMYEGRRYAFRENMRRFLNNEPFIYVCDKTAGF